MMYPSSWSALRLAIQKAAHPDRGICRRFIHLASFLLLTPRSQSRSSHFATFWFIFDWFIYLFNFLIQCLRSTVASVSLCLAFFSLSPQTIPISLSKQFVCIVHLLSKPLWSSSDWIESSSLAQSLHLLMHLHPQNLNMTQMLIFHLYHCYLIAVPMLRFSSLHISAPHSIDVPFIPRPEALLQFPFLTVLSVPFWDATLSQLVSRRELNVRGHLTAATFALVTLWQIWPVCVWQRTITDSICWNLPKMYGRRYQTCKSLCCFCCDHRGRRKWCQLK